MSTTISKSRSRKSRQRERESAARNKRRKANILFPIAFAFLAWLSSLLLLMGVRPFYTSNFIVGQEAPSTVVAMTDFESIDLARTELDKQQAASRILPVFSVDYSGYEKAMDNLKKIVDVHAELRSLDMLDHDLLAAKSEELQALFREAGINVQSDLIASVLPAEPYDELYEELASRLREVYSGGIATQKEKDERFQGVADVGSIDIENGGEEYSSIAVDDLLTPRMATQTVVDHIREVTEPALPRSSLTALVSPMVRPNLQFNPSLTEERREAARRNAPERHRNIRKGEVMVRIGETVTPQINEILLAHQRRMNETVTFASRVLKRVGQGVLLMIAMLFCVGLFKLIEARNDTSPSALALMLATSVLVLLSVRSLVYVAAATRLLQPTFVTTLLPLALAAMMIGLLIDLPSALVTGVWVAASASVMLDNSFAVLFQGLAVSVVGAITVSFVRKRFHIFRAGLQVGLVIMVLHIALGVYHNQPLGNLWLHALLGLANGLLCALLALFLVPIMEYLFGRTTDIRLLELSDMSHPLLRRLAIEAPGTYHHSLMVANLAQSAADEIGANSLLVRVGAYFHDIGKLSKPEFFSENIKGLDNPHDEISPHMSMLIISAHVKEGVTMARRHKLPAPILEAIQQHHAAGTVKYFYHRAMVEAEQAEGGTGSNRFDGEHFRYDCPRPHSKEMAILALADSVEAAQRTIEKPTPSRIEALVDDIIQGKIKDHQLEESNLTMAELNAIKRSFVFTITNMRHARVAYPKEKKDESGDRKQSDADKTAKDGDQSTGSKSDGAGRETQS